VLTWCWNRPEDDTAAKTIVGATEKRNRELEEANKTLLEAVKVARQ